MGNLPDYACSCCGITNGDMFYDRDVEITERDIMEFEAYRKMWRLFKDQEKKIRADIFPKTRIGKQHSQATRDKISATIRAKKAKPGKTWKLHE